MKIKLLLTSLKGTISPYMNMLIRLLIIILGILLVAYYVPGIYVDGFYAAFITAIILGVLNLTLKPLLIILTLPIQILTLGLFTIVINAGLLWFVGSILEGFEVEGFVAALIGSLIISLISWVGNKMA